MLESTVKHPQATLWAFSMLGRAFDSTDIGTVNEMVINWDIVFPMGSRIDNVKMISIGSHVCSSGLLGREEWIHKGTAICSLLIKRKVSRSLRSRTWYYFLQSSNPEGL